MIPNEGEPNPFASEHQPQAEDTSDNAKSVSLLLTFGKFKYVCCGDLTWNTEAKLMTPNNPIGQIDLFMATHHGLEVSNNPVMVLALDPHVCVTCNGPVKGAHANTIATLKRVKSLRKRCINLHSQRSSPRGRRSGSCGKYYPNAEDIGRMQKGVWIQCFLVAEDGASYSRSRSVRTANPASSRHGEFRHCVIDVSRLLAETCLRHAEWLDQLDSTNDRALLLASDSSIETPFLIGADRQTAGRGRGANRWWGADGSLMFSIVVDMPGFGLSINEWPRFSLVTGLAIAETLQTFLPHFKRVRDSNGQTTSGSTTARSAVS